jgi:hypothetical protein
MEPDTDQQQAAVIEPSTGAAACPDCSAGAAGLLWDWELED